MMKSDADYLWCLHCERAYARSQARTEHVSDPEFGEADLLLCAYEDCDGDVEMEAWSWEQVRKGREDRYPEQPAWGTVYPQFD